MSPTSSRLYGLMLISPLPVAFFATTLMQVMIGPESTAAALLSEFVYLLVVTIAAIVVARRIRAPAEPRPDGEVPTQERSYGTRLLIMTGAVLLGCIALGSLATFVMTLGSMVAFGGRTTGEFSQDLLPFITLLILILLGAYGSYRLARLLRS